MAQLQIAIIGAGPTGLSAALALRTRGHDVRIVERNDGTTSESRAVGVNRRSLFHLESVGACDPVLARGVTIRQARFFVNGAAHARLRIPLPPSGPPALVALPQSATESILAARLEALGTAVEWGVAATSIAQTRQAAMVRAQGPSGEIEIEADFVLGADGARSVVRKQLGLAFEGRQYPGDWSLLDAELDWPWEDTQVAAFLDDPGDVLFMISLGEGRHRIIGNSLDLEERIRRVMALGEISWRNQFTLSERRVTRYGKGRVWIAGDAAHVHSPVGGMGMNLGIDDAFDFAASLGPGGFDAYEQRRLAAATAVMQRADRGFRLITSRNPAVKLFRNLGLKLLGSSAFVQRRIAAAVFALDSEPRGDR